MKARSQCVPILDLGRNLIIRFSFFHTYTFLIRALLRDEICTFHFGNFHSCAFENCRGLPLESPWTIMPIIISCRPCLSCLEQSLSWQIKFAMQVEVTRRHWAMLEFEKRVWVPTRFLNFRRPQNCARSLGTKLSKMECSMNSELRLAIESEQWARQLL